MPPKIKLSKEEKEEQRKKDFEEYEKICREKEEKEKQIKINIDRKLEEEKNLICNKEECYEHYKCRIKLYQNASSLATEARKELNEIYKNLLPKAERKRNHNDFLIDMIIKLDKEQGFK